jgi:hypothetical protein
MLAETIALLVETNKLPPALQLGRAARAARAVVPEALALLALKIEKPDRRPKITRRFR